MYGTETSVRPKIWMHEKSRDYVYPKTRKELVVECSLPRGSVGEVRVIYWNRFTGSQKRAQSILMKRYARDSQWDHYMAVIKEEEAIRYLRYYFQWKQDESLAFLSPLGILNEPPKEIYYEYLCTNECDVFHLPQWWQDAVVYQIFPERFKKAQSGLEPVPCEEWGKPPTRENFFGGNLQGITNSIEYLNRLGVTALYLNPIFESPSNHKYDTIDYFKIDPHFGSLDDFKKMLNQCHKSGIRVILDGVFNHIGYYSKQFQDVLKNGKESEFADWFYLPEGKIQTDPLNYECVGYYKWMPKLRFSNPSVRRHCLRVGAYWLELGIDGWRLDVCDEVDFTFWQEFRRMCKKINPNAVLLGETWGDGRQLMQGDQMDSVMNYLFRDAMLDFLANERINASAFTERIGKMYANYPFQSHSGLLNLIGSHDTERFLTAAAGDMDKLKLAAMFQFTFLGVPMIYYGDEHAMEGENDPDCRRTMCWDDQNFDLMEEYRSLIALRKEHSAMRRGAMEFLAAEDRFIAWKRQSDEETLIILANLGQTEQTFQVLLDEKQKFKTAISLIEKRQYAVKGDAEQMIEGSLAAKAFDILLMKEEENE